MDKKTRTLLRAAYITALLHEGKENLFPYGQLKILYGRGRNTPVRNLCNYAKSNRERKLRELADVVNSWFAINFRTTLEDYINEKGGGVVYAADERSNLGILYDLIHELVSDSGSQDYQSVADISMPTWIDEEFHNLVRPDIERQIKEWKNQKRRKG